MPAGNFIPGGKPPISWPPAPPPIPPRPRIILAMPLPFIFFIIFCICLCCLSMRFKSCNSVPEPLVILRLRDPFKTSGLRRSLGVMELIIASIWPNCPMAPCFSAISATPDIPGIFSNMLPMPPILFICCS